MPGRWEPQLAACDPQLPSNGVGLARTRPPTERHSKLQLRLQLPANTARPLDGLLPRTALVALTWAGELEVAALVLDYLG